MGDRLEIWGTSFGADTLDIWSFLRLVGNADRCLCTTPAGNKVLEEPFCRLERPGTPTAVSVANDRPTLVARKANSESRTTGWTR